MLQKQEQTCMNNCFMYAEKIDAYVPTYLQILCEQNQKSNLQMVDLHSNEVFLDTTNQTQKSHFYICQFYFKLDTN